MAKSLSLRLRTPMSAYLSLMTIFAVAIIAAGCSNPTSSNNNGGNGNGNGNGGDPPPVSWIPVYECQAYDVASDELDRSRACLGLSGSGRRVVIINFDAAAQATPPAGIDVTTDNANGGRHIVVNTSSTVQGVNIIVSGTTNNGSLMIFGDNRINLYLRGANIRNPNGPAINIQNGSRADVYLVGHGCGAGNSRTILADENGYDPAGYHDPATNNFIQAKGTFFSEAALQFFNRGGSLEIYSRNSHAHRNSHALVSDDYIQINGGNIIIHESRGDGLHANDRIQILGGSLQIKCEGDAIQNERSGDNHDITISSDSSAATVRIYTTGVNGHGITSDSANVNISGGDVVITTRGNGSKGLRSSLRDVTISGSAEVVITSSGDRHFEPGDTSTAAGIRTRGRTVIEGGAVMIAALGDQGRGINANGDVVISGGIVNVDAHDDGIHTDGTFRMSGGSVRARSKSTQDIDCNGNYSHTGGTLDAGIDSRKDGGGF